METEQGVLGRLDAMPVGGDGGPDGELLRVWPAWSCPPRWHPPGPPGSRGRYRGRHRRRTSWPSRRSARGSWCAPRRPPGAPGCSGCCSAGSSAIPTIRTRLADADCAVSSRNSKLVDRREQVDEVQRRRAGRADRRGPAATRKKPAVSTAATPTNSARLSRPKNRVCRRTTPSARSTTSCERERTRSACPPDSPNARAVATPPTVSSSCCWTPAHHPLLGIERGGTGEIPAGREHLDWHRQQRGHQEPPVQHRQPHQGQHDAAFSRFWAPPRAAGPQRRQRCAGDGCRRPGRLMRR